MNPYGLLDACGIPSRLQEPSIPLRLVFGMSLQRLYPGKLNEKTMFWHFRVNYLLINGFKMAN